MFDCLVDYDSEQVTEDHGRAHSRVCVLAVHHRLSERLLHLLPQHLIAGDGAPTAHNPADAGLLQTLSGHHGGEVVQDSAAQRPGQVTQGEIGRGDVGDLTQAERVVPLAQDCRTHSQVARSRIQAAVNQLLVQASITHLCTCQG